MEKNICGVLRKDLCIGCGTCYALCPSDAIVLIEEPKKGVIIPKIDNHKCTYCGICYKVCPGIQVDFSHSSSNEDEKHDFYLGNYIECYAGYAVDQKLRYNSSSGGLVTALANFALKTGLVDGVLSVKMNPEKPLLAVPFIARDEKDLLSASGSKYCPVSINVLLKEILKEEYSYLAVGLPCHIQGIRKASRLKKIIHDRTQLCFGLVCNHTPTFHATKYVLKNLGISEKDVVDIKYRSKIGIKGMNIKLINGEEICVPSSHYDYWGFVFRKFFWPNRCALCEDRLNDSSDITFMDAWLPEFSSDKLGTSLIIVRTKRGKDLVDRAIKNGLVKLTKVSSEKIKVATSIKTVVRNKVAVKYISQCLLHKQLPSNKYTSKPRLLDLTDVLYFVLVNIICSGNPSLSRGIVLLHAKLWSIFFLKNN